MLEDSPCAELYSISPDIHVLLAGNKISKWINLKKKVIILKISILVDLATRVVTVSNKSIFSQHTQTNPWTEKIHCNILC